jgi:hypothetical protein
VVIVALSAVTLLAITGLAIDGGMAVGAYRHAQNAADAGALAAARQVYLNAVASPHAQSNSTTLTPVAQAEVQRNGATLGTVSGGGTSLRTGSFDSADGISRSFTFAAAQLGSVLTGSETVYIPNVGQGLTDESALADMSANVGTPLAPVIAELELVGSHATTLMNLAPPDGAGSQATAKVAVAIGRAPSLNQSGSISCYTADAHYQSGKDSTGPQVSCPDSGSPLPTGVSAAGIMAVSPNPDARVGADNHPTAWPRMIAGSVTGSEPGVSVSSTYAASGARLSWEPTGTLSSSAAVIATGVSSTLPGLTIAAAAIEMTTTLSVDSKGNTTAKLSCIPTTVNMSGALAGGSAQVSVDSSCKSSGQSVSGVTVGWAQPLPAAACSTAAGTGVVSCAIDSCFLHVALPATPTTTLCLGQNRPTLSATPVTLPPTTSTTTSSSTTSSATTSSGTTTSSSASTPSGTTSSTSTTTSTGATTTSTSTSTPAGTTTTSSTTSSTSATTSSSTTSGATSSSATTSTTTTTNGGLPPNLWVTQFTGAVTVSAQVDQPTYFLSILGWTHTTPAATASADIESVIDESASAFAANPFAMPDAAWSLDAPSRYEHLTVGHSYYLYGAQMQANSPAPVMAQAWQGQLAPSSAHRVGSVLTPVSTLTTTPHAYVANGGYCLVPIFNPMDGSVEEYGVFVAAPGHPSWYTLVNSVPVQGYIVQSTSVPGWITFEEGAVSIKLMQ